MATYRELAETLQRNLAGGDVSADFAIELDEIYVRINQLIPFLVRKDFYETYQFEQEYTNTNTYTTFIANIYKDKDTKEMYLLLPTAPLIIHGRGIPEFFYIQDRISSITYFDISYYRTMSDLGVLGEIKGGIAMYEKFYDECGGTENRIILKGIDNCTEKLKVRMIMSVSTDIDEDAQIPIDEHLIEPLIQQLRAWYTGQDKEVQDNNINGRNDNI